MRLIDADKMRENLLWCKEQSGSYNDIYCDDVIERLDVQPTVGCWISVKDRLPEEKQEALIFCCWTGASGEVYREIMIENIKSVIYQGYEPIAWMPLPEPPTEE